MDAKPTISINWFVQNTQTEWKVALCLCNKFFYFYFLQCTNRDERCDVFVQHNSFVLGFVQQSSGDLFAQHQVEGSFEVVQMKYTSHVCDTTHSYV